MQTAKFYFKLPSSSCW